ncbi:MAG: PAS domain-containing protein [Phyllobacteriaceae bacterium]|nr:PAS domain-containing protein [Phyllobacteriaceae bacterium]
MRVTAENLAAALFQASPDCVKILDPDGRLLDMNPCGRSLMEIQDFAGLRDRPWISLWPEEGRARIAAALEDARLGRAGFFEADCPTAAGTPKQWEVSVLPIRDGAGEVVRILATSRDVTEAKRREALLTQKLDEQRAALMSLIGQLDAERRRVEETRSQISHTEKLRVLGRFVGSVVHDINNVLASMAGAARLLRRRAEDTRTIDILDHVDQAVDRGARLVRQLLDFSRSGEGEPEPVDLAAALAADGELLRHLVGRAVEVTIDVEEGIWPVLIAPGRLQSVLFNLVANARDALGAGPGHVRVVARNRGSLARAAGLPSGDWVEIAVIDDGPGMPPEVVARLGEPFFTTKEAGRGTGLGVPSAFDLAEQAGGRVEIDSTLGGGTRISLHLPRSGADGQPIDTPDADIDPALHGGATLLLVENEGILRAHLAGLLRGLGYTVVEAPDTATAEAVFAAGLSIDLVVSDLHLGAETGLDVAKTARRDRPDLPIVFMSGTWGMGVPIGEPVLTKPIDERRLARVVLERLGRVPASHLTRDALTTSDRVRGRIRDARIRALYDGWRRIAGETGRLPSPAATRELGRELDPVRHLVEVSGDAEFPAFTFREAGPELTRRLGRSLAESRVTTSDEDVLGSLGRAFRRASRGIVWFDYVRMRLGDGRIMLFERLLLPLSDDGERVTHLLGVALFDEVDG